MSKQVHCPECQSENTPGSKFCNHCGARLPKSTSVLCPRCQTPNPHNNFYCDNCGGRLRAEQNNVPVEEEPKPEASDLPTSAKMFTLPTRDPGDTGELDPASLPEWIKNQSDEPEKKEGTGKLPRLSDLTPEERGTAEDLPGWLINTENEELLIDSPDDITTEHFLHLIQDINEEEREKLSGLLSDPSIAGDAANLPDWLKDVAQPTPKETPAPPPVEELPAEEDGAAPSDADASFTEYSDEVPDWLGELGPPRTAMLGQSNEIDSPPSEPEPELESEDLPDWLTEGADSAEPTIEAQATEDIFSDADLIDNDVPDWLLADEQIEDTQPDNMPAEEETLDDLTLDTAAATSLTGWLAEFDTEDIDEETAVSPEEPAGDDNQEAQRSLTNWLTAFDEEDLIPEDEPTEPVVEEAVSEEPLPDWLTGIDDAVAEAAEVAATPSTDIPAESESIEDDAFDWISDLDEAEAEETPVAEPTTDATTTEDDSFDWLSDFDELPDDTPVVSESSAEAAADSLDWLSDEPTDEETVIETEDTQADLLDFDVATDSSLSTGDTGPLPDWLDDLAPATATSSQFDSGELDSTLEDLFGETPKDVTGELEWLEDDSDDEIEAEPDSVDSSLAPLVGAIGAAALVGAASQDDDATLDDDPDWLSELAEFDPNEAVESLAEETAVSEPALEPTEEEKDDFDVEAVFEATESADLDEFNIDDELLGITEQSAGDWANIDGILAGTAEDEALPDWLEQLEDVTDSEITAIEVDEEPPEEIPAWVANMRPGDTGELASVLPSALFTDSDAGELLDETEDLADAELPDWLDATIDERAATAEKESAIWLDSEGKVEDAPAELEALLADLPPAQAPEDMLQKAEIPDWLEDLKPRELTGEAAPIVESRLESSGPLAGMPNTIAIEPVIAMPRAASMPGSYAISPEQAQQALLLRQLVQEGTQPPQADSQTGVRSKIGLRILVAILILAAVMLGLYGPASLKSKAPIGVPIPASAMNTTISNAAGKTVLVAFEYTPALAGELNHEAETLLTQINAIGSPILTTSQYVAGTAVADTLVADTLTNSSNVTSLGFIPGEAMGLRQLGSCLGENAQVSPCTSLHNRSLNNEMANALADVGLVVVLTGERSSLVNWVEQVGASSDVPIVIGSTQALEPVVVPYYASNQVAGYLNGLPATVAYQQAYIQIPDSPAEAQYGAQSLVLLVTAVILLIGGLAFGFRKKKS